MGKVKGLLTAVALLAPLAALHAVPTPEARHAAPKKKKVTVEVAAADPLRSIPLGSFTPSVVDPSRAAGIRPQAAAERIFRFTPSGKSGDRKALTLGLSSRVATPEQTARTDALRPVQTAYNVGASVGWLGFSLVGGYSRMEPAYGPRREGVDLGLSYRGRNWRTTLLAVSETANAALAIDPTVDKRTSFELGGAYSLSSRLSLSAGARYQLITPLDPRLQAEKDPSVFVGTAFTF